MKTLSDIPISVLDLSLIRQGGTAAESFRNTLYLAKHAELWGTSATGWPSTTASWCG